MATATMTMPTENELELTVRSDEDASQLWLRRLNASGHERDAAVAELHALLLKAARFEIGRRRDQVPHLRGGDHQDLAQQSADDALLAVLRKLDDFRGESHFTTWAYKFALLEAGVKVRRQSWQGREIPVTEEAWATIADTSSSAGRSAEDAELLGALREEIEAGLSDRQREVLVSVTLNDVPIDVLAERLQTTRGALYKTLHDARRKLREALAARGFQLDAHRKGEP
ncbi:MAG TPA: sigma-70 family RNA polymerase sigma factor [Solirubrobacterales bacterium]|nr:sigma-70 family RNA polymerase sigma factor [Solirubrobacterales bacterium]